MQTNIGDIKSKFENELKLLRSAVEGVDITESDPRWVIDYCIEVLNYWLAVTVLVRRLFNSAVHFALYLTGLGSMMLI